MPSEILILTPSAVALAFWIIPFKTFVLNEILEDEKQG